VGFGFTAGIVVGPTAAGSVVETAGTVVVTGTVVVGGATVVVVVAIGVSTSTGTVVSDGADTVRITSCTGREPAGGPPTTNAAPHKVANPRSPPQVAQARRACRCWRERSTSGSSTNSGPT
jgi:hypothetical protein